jgi:GntR family transcriptional regulator, vanillate catabolism transcriptional regulator
MDEAALGPDQRSASTQSRLLAERLRQSLLDGAFAAGSRLNEVHLARTLMVSRTPLRAALQTLAGEGLLHHIPNRGFTVPARSLTAMIDAYEMRALGEGLAARFAAERGLSEEMRLRMEVALTAGDKALADDTEESARRALYAEANETFHGIIHEAAQSQLVVDVLRICQRVPHTSARNIVAFELADVRRRHAGHRKIYEAIICREPREAEQMMRQHVLAVKLSVARWFSQLQTEASQTPPQPRKSAAR